MKKMALLLFLPFILNAQGLTTIDSDKAHFDGNKMILSEGVHLDHELGKVSADHAILTPSDNNTALMFDEAELSGDVKIQLSNTGTIHSDKVIVNLTNRSAQFEGKQVHYADEINQVFADKIIIDYGKNDLQRVILKGKVKVMSRGGLLLQYILSDTAEYFPETNTITFLSEGGNRVLFFDQPNNIQMSAPGLRVVRGEKESIQGIGDVRFELIEEELKELRKRFLIGGV